MSSPSILRSPLQYLSWTLFPLLSYITFTRIPISSFAFLFFPIREITLVGSRTTGTQRIDRDRREKISDLKKKRKSMTLFYLFMKRTIDENFERSRGRSTALCVANTAIRYNKEERKRESRHREEHGVPKQM